MSLVFEKELNDKPVQVEVTREGDLVFPDHDIAHDLAACEFGYPKTDAVYLYESWKDDPVGALLVQLSRNNIDEKTIALIAIEWAKHVLPIFERMNPKSRRPRILLDASKSFLDGTMSHFSFKHLRTRLKDLGAGYGSRNIGPQTGSVLARLASHGASKAAILASKSATATFDIAHGVANLSRNAAGYDFCVSNNVSTAGSIISRLGGAFLFDISQALKDAEKRESDWQIRRFVDVVEAVSQGLDWPDIAVTP